MHKNIIIINIKFATWEMMPQKPATLSTAKKDTEVSTTQILIKTPMLKIIKAQFGMALKNTKSK
jgi:hypothetical protein